MIILPDKKAFSLTELLITSVLLIVLLTSTLTGFVLVKHIFAVDIAKATFQRDAAVIMSKITEGKGSPSGIRLSEAATVMTITDTSKLTFIGTDGVIKRTYSVSNAGAGILYSDTNGAQNIIYTAPQGATVGLVFGMPNIGAPFCITIDVTVSKKINGKTVLGALKSSVYLRNHPV
jgi:hypothetical protein